MPIALTESEEQVLPFIAAGIRPEKIVTQYEASIQQKAGVDSPGGLSVWYIQREAEKFGCSTVKVATALSNLQGER